MTAATDHRLKIVLLLLIVVWIIANVWPAIEFLPIIDSKPTAPTMCEIENRGRAVYCDGVLCGCTGDTSNYRG